MRIWSLHPKYLDAKGLVALWRETLLARHVLEGKTKGYTHHPQLERFKAVPHPVDAINQYLSTVLLEAKKRGYHFDDAKIQSDFLPAKLPVTKGQIEYEKKHLCSKLKIRDLERYRRLIDIQVPDAHPLFEVTEGIKEFWER